MIPLQEQVISRSRQGLILALGIGDAIRSLLYGIQPHDAGTFAGVVLAMVVVTLVAALPPAIRAARVDPVVALRSE